MPTTPDPFPAAAAASNPRCTAADVKADRRSPAGPGLDTGEDQRTLTKAEATPAASPDHRHNAAMRASALAEFMDVQRVARIRREPSLISLFISLFRIARRIHARRSASR